MRARRRVVLLAAVAAVAIAVGMVAGATGALRSLELDSVDARFSIRGSQGAPRSVAVVGVDDQTLADLDRRWPFPRSLHARATDRLRRDGAAVIAYDVQFTEPTRVEEDNALIEALRRAGNAVLATSQVGPGGRTRVLGGAEGLRFARAGVGSVNFPPRTARGGVVRRLPRSERGLPSFAVAAATRRTGRPVERAPFSGDGAWIDFRGPPGTIPAVSFSRVLAGRFAPGTFRDRVVVVGTTAPVLQDVRATAAGEGMAGPEINANAIDTILRGFPRDDAPGWLDALAIVLLGLVAPAAALGLHGLRWLFVPLLAGAAWLLAAQLAFDGGTILPVADPLAALAVGLVGTLAVTYFAELRERRRVRATFARFVPEQVVDEVIACTDDDLRLGGVRREGTVVFCDLRGFTAAAEHLPAERVIELLNRYLTEMSDAILAHGGTVVSYEGDGVMSVFGAPLPQEDHRDRAVAAVAEMAGPRLERFNAWVRDAGLGDGFRVGIGVASGPVMSGNVGSPRRLEYTAVGDTTNTASRLESLTKEQGCSVLIADSTRAGLRSEPPGLSDCGELQIRGRSPLKAWSLEVA